MTTTDLAVRPFNRDGRKGADLLAGRDRVGSIFDTGRGFQLIWEEHGTPSRHSTMHSAMAMALAKWPHVQSRIEAARPTTWSVPGDLKGMTRGRSIPMGGMPGWSRKR